MSRAESLVTLRSAVGAEIAIDGRRYLNFGGSSYLGLASIPEILQAGIDALRECGSGVPVPLTHRIATWPLQEVEVQAAAFFGRESALFLAGGYYVGLATASAARARFGAIFYDELSHYALRDGIAASGLPGFAFRHRDASDLAVQLKRHLPARTRPLIATDGLYSTFGDIAPLPELAQAMAPYDGRLLIDESHSFGVLGDLGRGAVEHFGIDPKLTWVGGSLGKAFGTCGGVIPASEADVAAFCATPVGLGASTGLGAAAAMCARSLRYVRDHPELLQRLRANTVHMKLGLKSLGLDVGDSVAPIAAFSLGSRETMRVLKERLMGHGIFVYHSVYIGAGEAGVIRCAIFADHTSEQIDGFLHTLERLL